MNDEKLKGLIRVVMFFKQNIKKQLCSVQYRARLLFILVQKDTYANQYA